MLPHCDTCSCRQAPWPATSDVRHLPVDLAEFAEPPGSDNYVWLPISLTTLTGGELDTLAGRVARYRRLIREGDALNIREAVIMVHLAQQRWMTQETERHANRQRQHKRTRVRNGYDRCLERTKAIIRAEGGPCQYCGAPNPRTVDHKLPWHRGGDHRRKNLALCCASCNSRKGNRTPEEWKADRLKRGLPWPPLPRTVARSA